MMFLALFSSFFRWLWLRRVRALKVVLDPCSSTRHFRRDQAGPFRANQAYSLDPPCVHSAADIRLCSGTRSNNS